MEKREIKFRAWVKESKAFEYSNETNCCDWDNISSENSPIMQYTGLKDKNGKEIYEGDILCITDYPYKEASQEKDLTAPYYKNEQVIYEAPHFLLGGWLNFDCESEYEIIGNIYENPELLK